MAAAGPRALLVLTVAEEAAVVVVVAPVEVVADVTTVMPATVPALEVGTVGVGTVGAQETLQHGREGIAAAGCWGGHDGKRHWGVWEGH